MTGAIWLSTCWWIDRDVQHRHRTSPIILFTAVYVPRSVSFLRSGLTVEETSLGEAAQCYDADKHNCQKNGSTRTNQADQKIFRFLIFNCTGTCSTEENNQFAD